MDGGHFILSEKFNASLEDTSGHRIMRICGPHETRDGLPVIENLCLLRAALDEDANVMVVLDRGATRINFEVDREDEILPKAERILRDVIDVNGWSDRGWAIIVDVASDISQIIAEEAA